MRQTFSCKILHQFFQDVRDLKVHLYSFLYQMANLRATSKPYVSKTNKKTSVIRVLINSSKRINSVKKASPIRNDLADINSDQFFDRCVRAKVNYM
jgi:hypothetical protein